MQPTRMAKADFLTSLAVIALGLGALVESYRMPRLEHLSVDPYTVPGIVPGLVGAVIAALGAVLLVRSCRRGGWRLGGGTGGLLADAPARRLYLSLGLTLGYAAGLVGRVPFWLATGMFVFLFITLFEWPAGKTGGRPRRIATSALLAVAVTVAVTAIFERLFLVRLP